METFNVTYPAMVVVGIVLSLGFFVLCLVWGRVQHHSVKRFGRMEVLKRFSRFSATIATAGFLSLALVSLSIAASEPVFRGATNTSDHTLNAVVVMDVSRSMFAPDGLDGKTRLESVVGAVEMLLDHYPEGRFGLVAYTGDARTYIPTTDHAAIRIILAEILDNYQASAQGEGSDPVNALAHAADMLGSLQYPIETVFVISDGGWSLSLNSSRPPESPVIDRLRRFGVRIVAVGVGGLIPIPIPVYNERGEFIGYHQYQGSTVFTALDETSLRHFAQVSGGWYWHLAATDDLATIVRDNALDREPTIQDTDVSLVFVPVAIALLLVALVLLGRR